MTWKIAIQGNNQKTNTLAWIRKWKILWQIHIHIVLAQHVQGVMELKHMNLYIIIFDIFFFFNLFWFIHCSKGHHGTLQHPERQQKGGREEKMKRQKRKIKQHWRLEDRWEYDNRSTPALFSSHPIFIVDITDKRIKALQIECLNIHVELQIKWVFKIYCLWLEFHFS